MERMLPHSEPPRNFRNRIGSLGDLTHGVTLEIAAEISLAIKTLTSILGGIHILRNEEMHFAVDLP